MCKPYKPQHRKPAIRLTRAGWAVATTLGLAGWAVAAVTVMAVLGGVR